MNKKIIYAGVGVILLISLFLGYVAGRGYKTYEINLEKKSAQKNNLPLSGEFTFGKEIVDPDVYAPKITKLAGEKDSTGGYNLNIQTANLKFAPQLVGKEVEQNVGHAYVYVNNVPAGRAYSSWFYIPENFFNPGTNTISVTLNANNYKVWWSKKGTLEARANLEIFKN